MNLRTVFKSSLILLAAATVLSVAVLAWMMFAPRHAPAGQPPLSFLESGSLPAFREAFNASGGETRVLALLSPT